MARHWRPWKIQMNSGTFEALIYLYVVCLPHVSPLCSLFLLTMLIASWLPYYEGVSHLALRSVVSFFPTWCRVLVEIPLLCIKMYICLYVIDEDDGQIFHIQFHNAKFRYFSRINLYYTSM